MLAFLKLEPLTVENVFLFFLRLDNDRFQVLYTNDHSVCNRFHFFASVNDKDLGSLSASISLLLTLRPLSTLNFGE